MNANHTIGRRAHSLGAEDAMGNAQPSWAAAVDVPVFAIYNATSETDENARDADVDVVTVLLPSGSGFTPRDLAVIDGDEYTVEGALEPFTRGPFSFAPGDRLSLSRVEG